MKRMTDSYERQYHEDYEAQWRAQREAEASANLLRRARRGQRIFSIVVFVVVSLAALYLLAHVVVASVTH